MSNQSLHQQKVRGGKLQKSIAQESGIPEQCGSLLAAVTWLMNDVSDNSIRRGRIEFLLAEVADDLDERLSQIEERICNMRIVI
jgi:hypothetical protein